MKRLESTSSRHYPLARRRAVRGATVIELLTSVFVIMLTTLGVLSLTSTASYTADRRTRETSMGAAARSSLDEMLRELRAAREVSVSGTAGGAAVTTGDSNILFKAPSYQASSAQGIRDGFDDTVAFRFDATQKTVSETTVRDLSTSERPLRTNLVIARSVKSVAYKYRVREQFDGNGTFSYVLSADPDLTRGTLTAYVNGVSAACSYVSATRTAKLTGLSTAPLAPVAASTTATGSAGDDVQFLYTVDPAAGSGKWLPFVNGVDVVLTLAETDGRAIERTVTLAGNARLRNRRDLQ